MLLSTPLGGHPLALISGFGATPTTSEPLKKLQLALVALSDATKNPAIKPSNVAGTLTNGLPDDGTMRSITAALGLITPHLPRAASIPLVIAFGFGASTDTAKQAVLDYADYLRDAVVGATAAAPYYNKADAAPAASTTPTIFASTGPWYATWWGIAAIAVGALGTIALVRSHRAQAA